MNKSRSRSAPNEYRQFLRTATEEGFVLLCQIPFVTDTATEALTVMFHATDGILLVFDTFGGNAVNSGQFYYNWKPNELGEQWGVATTHGFVRIDGILVGGHDCRSLGFNLKILREYGAFVTPWVEQPLLWLLHHGDTKVKGYNHALINRERLALLPAHVRAAILALDPVDAA